MLELPNMEYLLLGAGVAAASLAVFVLVRGARGITTASFAAGLLVVAVQEFALFMAFRGQDAGNSLAWARVATGARMVLPIPWLIFGLGFAAEDGLRRLRSWAPVVTLLGGLGIAGIVILPSGSMLQVIRLSDPPRNIIALGTLGTAAHLVTIFGIAAVLFTLESVLRQASGKTRGRIKHFILGVFALFGAEIYAISHSLLFSSVRVEPALVEGAGILISTGLIAFAAVRQRLLSIAVYVSREVIYRSAAVTLVGAYLFVVGVAGEAVRRFDIPMRDFFLGVGGFVALLSLGMAVFSERVRRRVKLYIDTNFYRHKHDYRRRWIEFARNLGPAVRLEEVLPKLLETLMQAVWVERAGVFLADGKNGDLVLAQGIGLSGMVAMSGGSAPKAFESPNVRTFESTLTNTDDDRANGAGVQIQADSGIYASLEAGQVVDLGDAAYNGGEGTTCSGFRLFAPMKNTDGLMGVLAIGPERSGKPFTTEDRDLLATIANQAAAAIQTARLSQDLATAKSMEAVHRVATFLLHDLKNCASVMTMVAEHARKHMGNPEFQREAIEAVSSNAPKMRALIAKLSGLRSGPEIEREPMEVERVVEEALSDIRKGLNSHVVLKTDLRPTPQVLGDPEQISRVVTNLLVNAAEAMGEAGEVSIETFPEASWACIRVKDTGPGIPEAHLRNGLFQPFRSTKPGGLGIGLYQCKTIVEAHGGRIDVLSTEGAGSTFTVYLPIFQDGA